MQHLKEITALIDTGSYTKELRDRLIYEAVDEVNSFPHFYGPDKTFGPLPLDSVVKAEKLTFINGNFTCSFLT
ncbi:hypothetical protein ISN45_Aa02g008680 [Arabidopsis thaliana x Arabidopsis arenosa]|uniref:Uncharacterized protein n=1 Tax=Arabidopsis thaliana x Arabidopsis arenosa TaxID=1240361 RepID=A0A8T2BH35_9BRAS|nr:hypothetical protein ISN45_Aa02g008680 [Arabidopsis thaliana x Arabidopsis arenosa]